LRPPNWSQPHTEVRSGRNSSPDRPLKIFQPFCRVSLQIGDLDKPSMADYVIATISWTAPAKGSHRGTKTPG
jgi:hypothetical protein